MRSIGPRARRGARSRQQATALHEQYDEARLPPPALDLATEGLASGPETWTALPDVGEAAFSDEGLRRGTDYLHARFRSPAAGRFFSVDPIARLDQHQSFPQQWNRYAYAAGNPLKFVDPTGLYIATNQKGVDALQEALDEAGVAAELQLETVEVQHSFLGFKWTTTETRVSSGGLDLSSSDNPTAQLIGSAISTDSRIDLSITDSNLSRFGGAVTDFSIGHDIHISINPGEVGSTVVRATPESGLYSGAQVGVGFSLGTAVVHELGHAYGRFAAGEPRYFGNTAPYSLKYENLHRKLLAKPPLVPLVREKH